MGSKYHFIIFWGFIVITIGSVETLIQGLFPAFTLARLLGDTWAASSPVDRRVLSRWCWRIIGLRLLPAHRVCSRA